MAVFDKASLVMIPSQYKEGKIYNIKPEDQSSSFEFERGSAATRVNSSGLIEYVGVGEELATATNWVNGATYDTNTGTLTATNLTSNTSIDVNIENNETYLITYTIVSITSTGVGVRTLLGGSAGSQQPWRNEPGAYTEIVTYPSGASIDKLYFSVNGTTSFEITDISLKQISNDTPRLDYSGTEPALLLEPQRTNLVTYSEDFTQWSKNNVTLVGGYSAPDGTNTAYKVSGDSTSSLTFSLGLSGTETRTIWAKTVSGTGQLNLTSHNANTNNLFTITENWERFEVNGTTSTSGRAFFYAVDFRGSSTLTEVIIWGAQVEQGSYATSYIPTNGQTETRLADVCQGGGDASVFNDSEGVLYAEIEDNFLNEGSFRLISINNADADSDANSVTIGFKSSGDFYFRVKSPSRTYTSQTTDSSLNQYHKVALRYDGGDFSAWVNGVEVESDDSTTQFSFTETLDNLSFDYNGNGTLPFYGSVRALHYFPEALTDTELQQLTTI